MRHPGITAPLCAAAVVLAGCGGSGQSASEFAVQAARQTFAGDYRGVWTNLYPGLQHVTSRSFYERCQVARFALLKGTRVDELKALGEHAESIVAPGIGRVDAVAVNLRARITVPIFGRQVVADTVDVVKVDGRWRGIWRAPVYRAYRAGRCPR